MPIPGSRASWPIAGLLFFLVSPAARATDSPAADEATEHEGATVEASAEQDAVEDPDLESGEELESEDFASPDDPMLEAAIPAGDAEGVLEEDEG